MDKDYQITTSVQELTTTFIHKQIVNEAVFSQRKQELQKTVFGANIKRAQYSFPTPENINAEGETFFCDAQRVISIYNKHNTSKREKLTSTIQRWFIDEAKRYGWAHAEFITCVQSNAKACLLVKHIIKENVYVSTH